MVATSCGAPPSADRAAVQAVLDSTLAAHGRFAIAKNVDSLLTHYTPDAVVRSNHSAPLRGEAAVRPFIGAFLADVAFSELTYRTEQLAVYGDSAWHIVNFRFAATVGGQPMADSGGAFMLWTRGTDGQWRIKEDILNSYVPLAPPAR
jgi:uncharacterized protein (TIGR02246 family)